MAPRTRREFIAMGVGGVATVALGAAVWREVLGGSGGDPTEATFGYGPRRPPDPNGIRLPAGFESRVVARGGEPVAGTGYSWHWASDGMATFPTDDGGWILVSNSETDTDGGASAVRFTADGEIADAYRILGGTERNCSGGGTPWGTWLSCEEVERGAVWECDPSGRRDAVRRPAMGIFQHEAAAVDPRERRIYMTEDLDDGGFYRFTPDDWPDLSRGLLEIASVDADGATTWRAVPDPSARDLPTREQVDSTRFARGEGIWFDDGTVFVATTTDNRVHAYDVASRRFDVLYDGSKHGGPLLNVDQMTATSAGEIFVCENRDAGEMSIGMLDRGGRVVRFLSIVGPEHEGSEPTGVTFDPTGRRMYFASQRAGANDAGAVYELSGPFNTSA